MSARRPLTDVSLRDPDGAVRLDGAQVLRLVVPEAAERFSRVLSSAIVRELLAAGEMVSTEVASPTSVPADWCDTPGVVYVHQRAPFISHPCEWSPLMLACAARFTLELAFRLLPHGLMLKDATPSNIQFFGARPVLVDVTSIVERPQGSYLWQARQQFETTFLLPLLVNLELGLPTKWSLQDANTGVSHETCARLLGLRRWIKPSLIASVALPAAVGRAVSNERPLAAPATFRDDRKAQYVIERGLITMRARTRAVTRRLESRTSHWSSYQEARQHYSESEVACKTRFVTAALQSAAPRTVLDIGANTGEFSALAATNAAVVSVEADEVAASAIFRCASNSALDIHPVTVDFARPTPATGWRNTERSSFLSRTLGAFDMVMMLAVIHHIRVTGGIPVSEILCAAGRMTRRYLLIELVPRADPMFTVISRGRDALYEDCDREAFEAQLAAQFTIEALEVLGNGRVLYLAQRIGGHWAPVLPV